MQLKLPVEIAPEADGGELLLEHGQYAGRKFNFECEICPNPCCKCAGVDLYCVDAKGPETGNTPLRIHFDVAKGSIYTEEKDPSAPVYMLAQAILFELSPAQGEILLDRFKAVKQAISESDDLEIFTPDFEPATITGSDAMVSYHDILPHAKRLQVETGGYNWVLDEQYCLRPSCACTDCALTFIRIDGQKQKKSRKSTMIAGRVDYSNSGFRPEPSTALKQAQAVVLLHDLKAKYSDLNDILKGHHTKLKRLLEKVTGPQKSDTAAVQAGPLPVLKSNSINRYSPAKSEAPKPGRNDPCPCGSGKKYKKCCGGKQS